MTYDTINDAATMRGDDASTLGRIDKYELVRELGEGGFGTVYLAHDTVAGVDVAVKGLPPEVKHNESELESIRGNFALVKRLRHPNIVAVTDLHLAQSVKYLSKDAEEKLRVFPRDTMVVMDYAPGVTLAKWRRQFSDGKVPVAKALEVVRQVASALDYAHGQKVLHRDVKPANVMVEESSDGRLAAHVLDFGLAAEIRSSMGRVSREIRDTSGTRPYMAPEQWKGERQGPATDQYALAAMFYELVVGDVPFASVFDCGDPAVMRIAVTTDAPAIPADLPKCVRRTLAVALAKKPEERFASCGEFAAALEGMRVSSPSQSRGPRPVAAKGILIATLLAVIAGGAWWFMNARSMRSTGTTGVPPVAAEADVAEIAVEATVQKARIERIDDADGFRARKDSLADVLVCATANGKAGRWADAAQGFTNYVKECETLLELDVERKTAKKSKADTEGEKTRAFQAEASQYAETRWNAANRFLEEANNLFGNMAFGDATTKYAAAARQFRLCVDEAKTERKRREDEAAAKAAAEQEKREREARERERRAKWRQAGRQFTVDEPYGFAMTMKWCPAGTFTMGSPLSEDGRYDNERQHEVKLTKGFWMGETEVTQGQWKKLMDGETIVDLARKGLQDDTEYMTAGKKQTLREFWGMSRDGDPMNRCGDLKDDVPVYNVSWNEAVEFCRRLTQRERAAGRIPDGYEYRLPTEAEWEYACRAGTTTALPNGRDIRILGQNNALALDDIAWYGGNSSVGFDGRGCDTSNWPEKQYPGGRACAREVKGKRPNRWGLYDMIGNVWEWCNDWYGDYPYGSATDSTGAATGAYRVLRGGGWSDRARRCRPAYRAGHSPGIRSASVGFRVALAPKISADIADTAVSNVKEERTEEDSVVDGQRVDVSKALPNTLTPAEKAAGWKLLWDGCTFNGWVSVKNGCNSPPEKGWKIENGVLTVLPRVKIKDGSWVKLPPEQEARGGGGDIVTVKEYKDFILDVDFRLTKAARSSIGYFYKTNRNHETCEKYQIIDAAHPDASKGRDGNRRIASLYDIIPAHAENIVRPLGEWNTARIVSRGKHVEHWLNGVKVVEYERGSDDFRRSVSQSKYACWATGGDKWGELETGRILLNDHMDSIVSFRNIKILEL